MTRTTPRRKTLAERDAQELASTAIDLPDPIEPGPAEAPTPTVTTASSGSAAPEKAPAAGEGTVSKPKSAPVKPAVTADKSDAEDGPSGPVRLGIYFRPGAFTEMKQAYLADFMADPDHAPNTIASWVAAAIDAHAARTPAARGRMATGEARGEGSGTTRSFTIPADTVDNVKAAMAADRQLARFISMSLFARDAITAAVEAARERADGNLPPAPARLPNRLTRL